MDSTLDFTICYNRYKKKLFNFVLRMTGDRMTSEDIVQTVFLRFFRNMGNIRNSSSVVFWLYKSARNEIYTHFRTKKRFSEKHVSDDVSELNLKSGGNAETEFIKNELREALMTQINLLPDDQKEVFLLKEYSDLSYEEIASICEIDTTLVKSRLYSARQKLMKKIQPDLN